MIQIDNSNFRFKLKTLNNIDYIFDEVREKWFVLKPEEWVRQNFIYYLINELKYPKKLLAIEKEIKTNTLKKRFDIVVYKDLLPWMLIECKNTNIDLNDNVIQQTLSYISVVKPKYFSITNGNLTLCWLIKNDGFEQLLEMPTYNK